MKPFWRWQSENGALKKRTCNAIGQMLLIERIIDVVQIH
jgi:hypothetical protein